MNLKSVVEKYPEVKDCYETFYYTKFSMKRSSWSTFPIKEFVPKLSDEFYSDFAFFKALANLNFSRDAIITYLTTKLKFTKDEAESITLLMLFKINKFIEFEY